MKGSPFIRGTIFLTMATMISKMLGFIYVIPFTAMVGTSGYVLYTYAYRPYTIMLSIATMGLPLAVSKMVSKYDQLNDYHTVKRVLKSGIVFMFIMGVISCFTLYMLAPHLAKLVIDGNDQTGNSVGAVTTNIRIVSFALILVPVMSLLRGFFQGFQSMYFCIKCSCRAIFSGFNHFNRKLCRFICFKSFCFASGWYFNVRCIYGSCRWINCFKCVLYKKEKALKEKEMESIPQTTKSFSHCIRSSLHILFLCCGGLSNSVVSDD